LTYFLSRMAPRVGDPQDLSSSLFFFALVLSFDRFPFLTLRFGATITGTKLFLFWFFFFFSSAEWTAFFLPLVLGPPPENCLRSARDRLSVLGFFSTLSCLFPFPSPAFANGRADLFAPVSLSLIFVTHHIHPPGLMFLILRNICISPERPWCTTISPTCFLHLISSLFLLARRLSPKVRSYKRTRTLLGLRGLAFRGLFPGRAVSRCRDGGHDFPFWRPVLAPVNGSYLTVWTLQLQAPCALVPPFLGHVFHPRLVPF